MRDIRFRAWDKKYKLMTACVTIEDISDGFVGLVGNEVMQFTGLRDQNGAYIYDGDIVESDINCFFDNGRHHRVVFFENGKFCIGQVDLYTVVDGFNPEVIGNIYENPELLKD